MNKPRILASMAVLMCASLAVASVQSTPTQKPAKKNKVFIVQEGQNFTPNLSSVEALILAVKNNGKIYKCDEIPVYSLVKMAR